MLASPYFLYRAEPAPEDLTPGSTYAINGVELASRLSFFLWSTVPDDELHKVAEPDSCASREVLERR